MVKVRKVKESLALQDLVYKKELVSGQRVCLVLPLKKSSVRKRQFKMVRGTFVCGWDSLCSCCVPFCGSFFFARVEKADGSKIILVDEYNGKDAFVQ
jgi:hypothetical protein